MYNTLLYSNFSVVVFLKLDIDYYKLESFFTYMETERQTKLVFRKVLCLR